MKKQEPKRHHYIPQFILKNFNNSNNQVLYYDIQSKKIEARNTRSVFMNYDMYRDELNHIEDPVYIEDSLSIFECEISKILKEKFIDNDEIVIDRSELEKIRIFLGLLSFRNDNRANQYKNNNFDYSTRKILSSYAVDDNYEDLWKREIEELSKMRSYSEFKWNTTIDPIIKMDFEQLLSGYYMTIVDARGGEFLITDVYPTLEIYPLINNCNINMHYLFPISPTRMIVLNHIMFKKECQTSNTNPTMSSMKRMSRIGGLLLKEPKNIYTNPGVNSKDDKFIYKPQKIYRDDLIYINSLFLNEARIGILFKDKDKIIESIKSFNTIKNAKQKLIELENAIFLAENDIV